jgi:hypothetical protein
VQAYKNKGKRDKSDTIIQNDMKCKNVQKSKSRALKRTVKN